MTTVVFDKYDFTVKEIDGNLSVWDIARKKYIVLTPEEKVRQAILHYLVFTQKISLSLIAVERKLAKNEAHRFDLLVFDRTANPLLLVECKAPNEKIHIDTLLQGGNYNMHLDAPFLWLSNGASNYVFQRKSFELLEIMPTFSTYL